MSTDTLALRQFVIGIKKLNESLTISDIVKELRRFEKYKTMKYNSLYRLVYRTIKRGTVEASKRNRAKPVRDKKNIRILKCAFRKQKKSKKCTVRKLQKVMDGKGVNMSRGTIHNALKEDLKKRWRRYQKQRKLLPHHKEARVKCAVYLRRKYGATQKSKKFGWDKIINTDFSAPYRLSRSIESL